MVRNKLFISFSGLLFMLLLAGCTAETSTPVETEAPLPTTSPEVDDTATPTESTPAGSPTEGATETSSENDSGDAGEGTQTTTGSEEDEGEGSIPSPTPVLTPVSIEVEGPSAEEVMEAWDKAYDLGAGIPFNIIFTEEQIEAAIVAALAQSGAAEITSVNITLDNSLIFFQLQVTLETGRTVVGEVVMSITVNNDGSLTVNIVSATAGRFTLPAESLTAISDALTATLTGELSAYENTVTITDVVVASGTITVSGYITP